MMTVILVHAGEEHAFFAADSCRWDLIQKRKLAPATKVRSTGDGNALALGGQNIDRDNFANCLIAARRKGYQFANAACQLAPPFFAEKQKLMQSYGVNLNQFAVAWYADCDQSKCLTQFHKLPNDCRRSVEGIDGMAPDTPWLLNLARSKFEDLRSEKDVPLDLWAFEIILEAEKHFPDRVSLPGKALMLRPGPREVYRDLPNRDWDGEHPDFLLRLND